MSQTPTAIAQSVKEALGNASLTDEEVVASDSALSQEQLQDEASPLIRGGKAKLKTPALRQPRYYSRQLLWTAKTQKVRLLNLRY